MKTLIKRLLKVLLVFSLFTSLSTTGSNAAPVDFLNAGTDVAETPDGDDETYRLSGISLNYEGVTYTGVYYSLNNVLSFGQGATDFADFPAANIPSISFNASDWTVDFYGGAQGDEYLTADLTGGVLTITNAAIPFGSGNPNTVTPTVTVVTITGVGGYATYSYTVGGVAGTDYSTSDPRTAARLGDGRLVPLSVMNSRFKPGHLLVAQSAPVLTQSGNPLTCKSSDFGMLNGGVTSQASAVQAVAYNLLIDGELVSRVVGGSAASLPATLQPIAGAGYTGTATTSSATWDIGSKSNFSAQCQVVGWQSGASGTSVSNSIDDSGKIAAAKAKAAAEESARQAALVEFNSKENRELRKRLAARGIRG